MTTPSTTVFTAYDLTVGVIVDMDQAVYLLDPIDSPLLNGTDASGLSVISSSPTTQKQFNWLEDNILPPYSTLAAAIVTADTNLVVQSGHQTRFSTGDVLLLGASKETVRITAYSATTADTLVITRTFGAAVASTHASGASVASVGTVLAEGSDPENGRVKDRTDTSNITQIFGPTAVRLSGTEQVISKYGVANEFTHQILARTREQVITRERAILYGEKVEDSSAKLRQTGGLDYYLTAANADTTSTQLTVATIESYLKVVYNRGGSPNLLCANPITLSDLNSTTDTARVRQEVVDSVRGRKRVTVVSTEFGDISIIRNRWSLPNNAFFYTRDNLTRRVLRPFQMVRLAKTGDNDIVQILCEEGYEIKGAAHAGKMTALSYS